MTKQLILASKSPRRRELLEQVKIPYGIRIAEVDEGQMQTQDPLEKVKQLTLLKGRSVPINNSHEVILSADTIVSCQGEIFEKPKNEAEAKSMLERLSGNIHEVYTGVLLRTLEREHYFVECTKVEFWSLTSAEIEHYIQTGDPYDKAGAYGIQSIGAMFVKQIIGDYYNVVGLPVSKVVRELRRFGIHPYFT